MTTEAAIVAQSPARPWSWVVEQDLMARLIAAQNHPGNIRRDVMTFAGFCDDRAELERHVVSCEAAVTDWNALHSSAPA